MQHIINNARNDRKNKIYLNNYIIFVNIKIKYYASIRSKIIEPTGKIIIIIFRIIKSNLKINADKVKRIV